MILFKIGTLVHV